MNKSIINYCSKLIIHTTMGKESSLNVKLIYLQPTTLHAIEKMLTCHRISCVRSTIADVMYASPWIAHTWICLQVSKCQRGYMLLKKHTTLLLICILKENTNCAPALTHNWFCIFNRISVDKSNKITHYSPVEHSIHNVCLN